MKSPCRPGTVRRPRSGNFRAIDHTRVSVNWEQFYTSEFGPLMGHGAWRTVVCPFHSDHHPSLGVNIEHGGFNCMACGARGNSIQFLQLRHGVDSIIARRMLEGFQ